MVDQILYLNTFPRVRAEQSKPRVGVRCPFCKRTKARTLLDAVYTTSLSGLCDRVLISLMVCTFARVGAPSRCEWRIRCAGTARIGAG